jgi:hypothetical protein
MKRSCLVLVAVCWSAAAAFAQNDLADQKTIERIVKEINLVSSLHARHQGQPNLKGMPKYSAKKLAVYGLDDAPSADMERRRWQADKDKYEKDHPVRATIFEAMAEMENVQKLELRMVLLGGKITPKTKIDFLREQEPIGLAIFKLERILAQMKEADGQRKQELNKSWLLNFDFAQSRVEANLVFLYEYNFTLGIIRVDHLPELRPGDAGWRIVSHPGLHITETKAKVYAKVRAKRLRDFRTEHADTPWAFFSEIEGGRLLGMEWTPAKE